MLKENNRKVEKGGGEKEGETKKIFCISIKSTRQIVHIIYTKTLAHKIIYLYIYLFISYRNGLRSAGWSSPYRGSLHGLFPRTHVCCTRDLQALLHG